MATLVVKQDGTGDYTTLAAALSAAVASDIISIEGSWTIDDTAVATVADNSLTIQTVGASRHPGYVPASPTHYRLRCATNGSHCITVNNTGCIIDGLEIRQGSTGTSDEGIRIGAAITLTVRKCLIHANGLTTDQDGIYHGNLGPTVTVENCIIWGFNRAGCHAQHFSTVTATATWNINSCTIFNCGHQTRTAAVAAGGIGAVGKGGVNSVLNMNVFNTIALKNDNAGATLPLDYSISSTADTSTITWNIDYSIDGDASIAARDSGAVGSLGSRTETDNVSPGAGDWVVFNDITTSPYDLRLDSSSENDAQDMHASATGAGLTMPSDDIVGTSRPQNTNYDCGAFEIVAASGAASFLWPNPSFQPFIAR